MLAPLMPKPQPDELSVTLPESLTALERQFHRASDDERSAILEAIQAQVPHRQYMAPGRPRSTPALRLFEARLLAISRRPVPDSFLTGYKALEVIQGYAWRDLVDIQSDAFIPLLKKLLRTTPWVRPDVLMHLAWTGRDRLLPIVLRALKSPKPRDVYQASHGLKLAVIHKRAGPRFVKIAFEALVPFVTGDVNLGRTDAARDAHFAAAEALLDIDHRRALALFKSPACLYPKNRAALAVLFRLQSTLEESEPKFGKPVDPSLLWRLYEASLAGKAPTFPGRDDGLQGLILVLAADTDPIRTKQEAHSLIKRLKHEQWSQGADFAREAIRRAKKIPEPRPCLLRLDRSSRNFSQDAADVLRAYELADHVLTDGLILYYYNCGVHLPDALRGLQLIDAPEAAKLLKQGAKTLVPTRATPSHRDLKRAYDAMISSTRTALAKLERDFERRNDSILTGVERYIAAHADQFRSKSMR
jgi:hypothetical protein